MDFNDLKNRSAEELMEILAETRAEVRTLRFQAHSRQLKQNHRLADLRAVIAKIQTILKSKKAK